MTDPFTPWERGSKREDRRRRQPDGLGAVGLALGMLTLLPLAVAHGIRRLCRKLLGRDPGDPFTAA